MKPHLKPNLKIVADEKIPLVNEFFGRLGEVVCLSGRQITPADVRDADALIVRSVTRIDKNLLTGSQVKFVGTCTIGVDHLDQAYLDEHKITWSSAPGCNANSVVEYVYSALCHLNINWLDVKVGIIGCGNVGGLLYKRLKAQGVKVHCYDPNLTTDQNPDLTDLDTVLGCDVISMHTPLVTVGPYPSFHLLDSNRLQQLKPGTTLINCGRGPAIHNQALLQLLNSRNDLRVVLDVWEPEPELSLDLLDKVALGSPHIAGYSYDGKLNGTEMIYKALCRHLGTEPQVSLDALVAPLENNQLIPVIDKGDWAIAKDLIKQVYDIATDDNALRAVAMDARSKQITIGKDFDHLRKHYPQRREFHNYRVQLPAGASTELKNWLAVLGFHCV
jgi:erythronate-4-phosphate dehydrogenase